MRSLVHHKLMLDTLVLGLRSLGREDLLRLLRSLWRHLRVLQLRGGTRIWQHDPIDVVGICQERWMSHEAADS